LYPNDENSTKEEIERTRFLYVDMFGDIDSNVLILWKTHSRGRGKHTNKHHHKTTGTIRITVHTLTGKNFNCDIAPNALVTDLKQLIEKNELIPANQQRLIFAGCTLLDDMILTDCGIVNNTTIHLTIKLSGC
jgi:ubiquitin-large subunit ribosomal protein L40e